METATDWARYWRAPDRLLETMHAHFVSHVYDWHTHETYSFGVTETGAQEFRCRGGTHTSAAGMVMAFNPDEPHSGRAAVPLGFTYRMVHIGPDLVADILGDAAGRAGGLPLFAAPVVHDPYLANALRRLSAVLGGGASRLSQDERLTEVVLAMVRRASATRHSARHSAQQSAQQAPGGARAAQVAATVREILHDRATDPVGAAEIADAAGCSRFAALRAFRAVYGLTPSDYQRQLRLRIARNLLADGHSAADTAALSGFADQAHLTRWFVRCYGITPGTYRRA